MRCSAAGKTPFSRRRTLWQQEEKRRRAWSQARLSTVPPLEPDATTYVKVLEAKAAQVRGILGERLGGVPLRVVASPALHQRHRVKMLLYHFRDGVEVGEQQQLAAPHRRVAYKVLDPEARVPVPVYGDPFASHRINELMRGLLEAFEADPCLWYYLGGVQFVSTDAGEGLVSLGYSRQWESTFLDEHLAPLAARLGAETVVITYRKKRLCVGSDHLLQWYEVQGRRYPQVLRDDTFSQCNTYICARMLEWAAQQTSPGLPVPVGAGPDLLELYCGNGNFTLPLAANFRSVLASESNKHSLAGVARCAELAGVDNVTAVRMEAEEVAEALRPGGRPFRRLRQAGVDLAKRSFGTVLVNPPRAGLSREAVAIVRNAPRVLYISCNPRSLRHNLAQLPHAVADAALFDQFPFTSHAEVGVRLERCE